MKALFCKNFLALMDKSKYKAQMDDIIRLVSINLSKPRSYRKEIVGYQIIQTLLDKFITALIISTMEMRNYDSLILKMLPEKSFRKENLYGRLLHICHFIPC
jgi:dGTPase